MALPSAYNEISINTIYNHTLKKSNGIVVYKRPFTSSWTFEYIKFLYKIIKIK